MKKLFILLAVLVMATNLDAKIRLGVKGGLNFANLSAENMSIEGRTGWHAGAMMNVGLPFGLSLQPELLYSSKGSSSGTLDYLEIPVDLQWGYQIAMVRPYLSLTPYVSYAINSNRSLDEIQNWDGGLGIGIGIDFWKLQFSVKYLWGFGNVSNMGTSVQNRNAMISLGFFL